METMTTLKNLKAKLLANPEVRREYEALALEREIGAAIVRARVAAGLTQRQLAERMGTAQSFITKLESGRTLPSTATLARVAKATGTRPHFELIAIKAAA